MRAPLTSISTRIPLATVSTTNVREHWAKRAKRAKAQRYEAYFWTPRLRELGFPLTITLTRISPRKLDDDNLRSALKSVRDGIADRLEIDDNDSRVTWEYGQRKGDSWEQAVLVEAVPRDTLAVMKAVGA